jgi:2-polyprenyl-3-methyl-5-hydroxy-6-metoxy-1,4-benzoquinol methylase
LTFYPHSKYYLDYGGGYGLFVRRMRDKGFSYYRDDIYCENIFAKYFDLKDAPVQKFDIVTAFEVFEHLNEPLADIGKMTGLGNSLLFSTILAPETKEAFDQWWYRAPLSGQHIAFYTMESLKIIATKFDKKLYSNGTNFHILSNIPIGENKWKEIFLTKKERKLDKWMRKKNETVARKSLLEDDYKMIENLIRKSAK